MQRIICLLVIFGCPQFGNSIMAGLLHPNCRYSNESILFSLHFPCKPPAWRKHEGHRPQTPWGKEFDYFSNIFDGCRWTT